MKRMLLIVLPVIFISTVRLTAATITINCDGSGNYTSIQEGIDNSVNGDTVLVCPGTYYENIDYLGKNITVGSLFLTEQDPSYIEQTIINGDNEGSVVTFKNREDTTATLTGFTITHGSGKVIETDGELPSPQ